MTMQHAYTKEGYGFSLALTQSPGTWLWFEIALGIENRTRKIKNVRGVGTLGAGSLDETGSFPIVRGHFAFARYPIGFDPNGGQPLHLQDRRVWRPVTYAQAGGTSLSLPLYLKAVDLTPSDTLALGVYVSASGYIGADAPPLAVQLVWAEARELRP